MSATRITGGCQCGAVRYALNAPLGRASICHCRMCQKAFGSLFAPLVAVPFSAFELTRGTLSTFESSDVVVRGFCKDCGTPLTFRYLPGENIDVSIGSLDDPSIARPTDQDGIESRLPWFDELHTLPGAVTEDDETPERYALIRRTNRQHPDHDTARWPPGGAVR